MKNTVAIVMFDLPSKTKLEKKNYRKFVKEIKANGFVMLQESIYVKFLRHSSGVQSVENMLNKISAGDGSVFFLPVTYNNFTRMITVAGSDFDIDFLCSPIIFL